MDFWGVPRDYPVYSKRHSGPGKVLVREREGEREA